MFSFKDNLLHTHTHIHSYINVTAVYCVLAAGLSRRINFRVFRKLVEHSLTLKPRKKIGQQLHKFFFIFLVETSTCGHYDLNAISTYVCTICMYDCKMTLY